MPSETVYLPDAEMQYVRQMRDEQDSVENISQALQRIVWDHKQGATDD
jgi:hypothetical protein